MQDKRMQKIAPNGYENEHGKTESLETFFVSVLQFLVQSDLKCHQYYFSLDLPWLARTGDYLSRGCQQFWGFSLSTGPTVLSGQGLVVKGNSQLPVPAAM